MGDDTMEISSEHGHNGADDEIDIDIDFTATYADDDYMLEDARSNIGFGDDPNAQPSPAAHDALMVDEDQDAYTMEDEDGGFDSEDQKMDADANIVQEAMVDAPTEPEENTMVEPVTEIPKPPGVRNILDSMTDALYSGDQGTQPVQSWEGKPTEVAKAVWHEEEIAEAAAKVEDLKGVAKNTASNDVKRPDAQDSKRENPPHSPRDQNSHTSVTGTSLLSPDIEPNLHDQEQVDKHVSDEGEASVSNEAEEALGTPNEDEQQDEESPIDIPKVVVTYQSTEYDLFSRSEFDDPDSYFLSNLDVLKGSLDSFFEAIRNVIHEDLGDEEELCLSVEDLGLEVEENSTSLREHTLGDIINVYHKLLSNNDQKSPRPLYMTIVTRPSFSKRLATLMSGATEGRSLSEMIFLDEGSEGIDESEAADESTKTYNTDTEPQQPDVPDMLVAEQRGTNDENIIASPSQSSSAGNRELLRTATADRPESDDIVSGGYVASDQRVTTNDLSSTNRHAPSDNQPDASGEHDEDDLIDYSEEEDETHSANRVDHHEIMAPTDQNRTQNGTFTDFFSPCLKPSACFCSKCSDLLLAEYEEINEGLRQRSVSRTAEESQLGRSTKTTPPNIETRQESHNSAKAKAASEDGDEIYYDRTVQEGARDLAAPNVSGWSEHQDYDEEALAGEDLEGDKLPMEHGIATGPVGHNIETLVYDDENGHENSEDEIEIYDEEHQPTPGTPSFDLGDIAKSSATLSVDEPRHEEDLDEYRNDESKSTDELDVVDNTGDNRVDEKQDEIDYEDGVDDEKQSSIQAEDPLPATGGGGPKRPLSDVEDGGAVTNKEAKRPRS